MLANSVTPIVPATTNIISKVHQSEQIITNVGIVILKYSPQPLNASLSILTREGLIYGDKEPYTVTNNATINYLIEAATPRPIIPISKLCMNK